MTPNKIIVDSSVIIKWLSQDKEEHLEKADVLLREAQNGNLLLIAPELAKYEVGNVLLYSKLLDLEKAKIVLEQFYNLPVSFITESGSSAGETYRIAQTTGTTYYDASFMSLAKQLDATLITDNIKHQGKAADIKVLPLSDYSTSSK